MSVRVSNPVARERLNDALGALDAAAMALVADGEPLAAIHVLGPAVKIRELLATPEPETVHYVTFGMPPGARE